LDTPEAQILMIDNFDIDDPEALEPLTILVNYTAEYKWSNLLIYDLVPDADGNARLFVYSVKEGPSGDVPFVPFPTEQGDYEHPGFEIAYSDPAWDSGTNSWVLQIHNFLDPIPIDPLDPPYIPIDPLDPPHIPIDPLDPPYIPIDPLDPPHIPIDPLDPPLTPPYTPSIPPYTPTPPYTPSTPPYTPYPPLISPDSPYPHQYRKIRKTRWIYRRYCLMIRWIRMRVFRHELTHRQATALAF